MDIRNAKYNDVGTIDCEINHPVWGWIPFTARPDDAEEIGRLVYEAVREKADPYVPAEPDPAEALAAWRQSADMEKGAFCIALMRARVLPADEAVAAAKGEWPATFANAISGLPVDADEAAIIWAATTRVRRLHPILLALIPKSPLTDADVDAMFGWKS